MNFEISYQLFHCALALFACCWRCSFRILHVIDVFLAFFAPTVLFISVSIRIALWWFTIPWFDSGLLKHHHSAARDGGLSFYGMCGLVCFL